MERFIHFVSLGILDSLRKVIEVSIEISSQASNQVDSNGKYPLFYP